MVSSSWSWKAFALRWDIFFLMSSIITFDEYFALYLKQLGFTASQIAFVSLWGVPTLSLPLVGFLADRYRARKLVLIVCILGLILLSLAPLTLLPKILYSCDTTQSGRLNKETKDILNTTLWVTNISHLPVKTSKNTRNLIFLPSLGNSVVAITDNQSFLLNRTGNPLKRNDHVSSYSIIFLLITLIRVLHIILNISAILLSKVAVMTYINQDRASFGSYFCWGQIGCSISLFVVGMIASYVKYTICGRVVYGYFVAFPFVAITMSLSLVSLPWISFKYKEHRVINWAEVKSIVFNKHYMIMLFITFYIGWCFSFQYYWEYWYIAELSGTPIVMAVGGLIRRTFSIIWYLSSEKIINKLGELPTVAIAPFIFAVSEISLSFIQLSWLVIVIDFFQSAAMAFGTSAITVHFSKAGSKASSGLTFGLVGLAYTFGEGSGGTAIGLLFGIIGAKTTLFYYSIGSTVILVLFIAYLIVGKKVEEYKQVDDTDSESE